MEADTLCTVEELLAGEHPEEVRRGLAMVEEQAARLGPEDARPLFEAVCALFYIDPLDRPDLVPVLDEAVSLVSGFGDWVIPLLIERLDASDLKAQIAVAHALGRMGAAAIEPLMAQYAASEDPGRRAFVLYALGKIKSPKIVAAARLALEAAAATDRELRDTGTRALGKLAESIPPAELPAPLHRDFIARLHRNLADADPAIRAKAVRSLGKLAGRGHLSGEEGAALKSTLELIVGRDKRFEWDRAYVVRKQAEEALQYV